MDVKIMLIDEGNEGRKVTVTVADDKGVQTKSQELQTPGGEVQPHGPQGRPGVEDRAEDRRDENAPKPPTETQFAMPSGGSIHVREAESPQVYDGGQRATFLPDSQAAKDRKEEEKRAAQGGERSERSAQGTMHPKSGREVGPSSEPSPQSSYQPHQPNKTPGDMTAKEAQDAHTQGQKEAQQTGYAAKPAQAEHQKSEPVDEHKGKVDMSKTVSPSTKK
jgi:hypothetical protein